MIRLAPHVAFALVVAQWAASPAAAQTWTGTASGARNSAGNWSGAYSGQQHQHATVLSPRPTSR